MDGKFIEQVGLLLQQNKLQLLELYTACKSEIKSCEGISIWEAYEEAAVVQKHILSFLQNQFQQRVPTFPIMVSKSVISFGWPGKGIPGYPDFFSQSKSIMQLSFSTNNFAVKWEFGLTAHNKKYILRNLDYQLVGLLNGLDKGENMELNKN